MSETTNGLQVFENNRFGKVRVVMRGGEPWFVAKDVCDCLELGNVSQALDGLDDDEKQQLEANITNLNVGGRGGAHQLTTQGVDTIRTLNDSNKLTAQEMIPMGGGK